jgi:hypothetical protein
VRPVLDRSGVPSGERIVKVALYVLSQMLMLGQSRNWGLLESCERFRRRGVAYGFSDL